MTPNHSYPTRPSPRSGSALLVVITILALMTFLLVANGRVVWRLNREIRLLEKRQVNHWRQVSGKAPLPVRPTLKPAE